METEIGNIKREKLLRDIFLILFAIIISVLFLCSFLFTWRNHIGRDEFVHRHNDNIFINLFGIGIVLLLNVFISSLAEKYLNKKKIEIATIAISIFISLLGAIWIFVSKTAPQADQALIVIFAEVFENGDFSSLHGGGGYVSDHRQQLGLITFMRIIFRLFGQGNFKAYQYFTASTLAILVYSGYRVVKILTNGNLKVQAFYLTAMLFCIPMYCYTPFVYGDLCSTSFVMLAAWIILSALKRFSWWKLIALAFCCGAMTQLRRNAIIIATGFLIVIIVKLIQKTEWKTFFIGISMLTGILTAQFFISALYRPYIPKDAKEMPAILFVNMGLHDNGEKTG